MAVRSRRKFGTTIRRLTVGAVRSRVMTLTKINTIFGNALTAGTSGGHR
jgi:hypothetical protein